MIYNEKCGYLTKSPRISGTKIFKEIRNNKNKESRVFQQCLTRTRGPKIENFYDFFSIEKIVNGLRPKM